MSCYPLHTVSEWEANGWKQLYAIVGYEVPLRSTKRLSGLINSGTAYSGSDTGHQQEKPLGENENIRSIRKKGAVTMQLIPFLAVARHP